MATSIPASDVLDEGTLNFTIESRIIREIGERLVKKPEVALLELVKNSYDAEASGCEIRHIEGKSIEVIDDGLGMTFEAFKNGWMRIGTSSKEASPTSPNYGRVITGEKGIGRFAVRFLGRNLRLESVAFDSHYKFKTLLVAKFNWPKFDRTEDLGNAEVPYQLIRAPSNRALGTSLLISELRPASEKIDFYSVRTASIGVVTPYHALLRPAEGSSRTRPKAAPKKDDPGFTLKISSGDTEKTEVDVAKAVLDSFVLKAILEVKNSRMELAVYRHGHGSPVLRIVDKCPNNIGSVFADIRFFPQRKGTYSGLSIDGRRAKTWVKENSGVAVFDRAFRVHPYGDDFDDWLSLSADAVRRAREPRSSIAKKHFPMDESTKTSTQLNYMLRLPYPEQLIGVVQVEGQRSSDADDDDEGLVASADREGFVDNAAFRLLVDLVRGAVEAIASVDRELQQKQERIEQEAKLAELKKETQNAIREIEKNINIARPDKTRIIKHLVDTHSIAEQREEVAKQRESALEIMSLLGVVSGFMTHEFGTALDELDKAQQKLAKLTKDDEEIKKASTAIAAHISSLREFVTYSQGYIQGATSRPGRPYLVRPRISQVTRVFGKYAADRSIFVEIEAADDLIAPLVPVSLYNGIALNLFTNALKAVTANAGSGPRKIAFRAWNEKANHFLEVSDTGIGIPTSLRQRVFEPLFTTTSSNRDPLGSGMGLGLTLVKRGVESFGGRIEVVDPPAEFSTCVSIRLPLNEEH